MYLSVLAIFPSGIAPIEWGLNMMLDNIKKNKEKEKKICLMASNWLGQSYWFEYNSSLKFNDQIKLGNAIFGKIGVAAGDGGNDDEVNLLK